jgi:hypothetical protein
MIGGVDQWHWHGFVYRCTWSGDSDHRSSFPRNQLQGRVDKQRFGNRLSSGGSGPWLYNPMHEFMSLRTVVYPYSNIRLAILIYEDVDLLEEK